MTGFGFRIASEDNHLKSSFPHKLLMAPRTNTPRKHLTNVQLSTVLTRNDLEFYSLNVMFLREFHWTEFQNSMSKTDPTYNGKYQVKGFVDENFECKFYTFIKP